MLNGQKLQGTLTCKEIFAILNRDGKVKEHPLFTVIYRIVFGKHRENSCVISCSMNFTDCTRTRMPQDCCIAKADDVRLQQTASALKTSSQLLDHLTSKTEAFHFLEGRERSS